MAPQSSSVSVGTTPTLLVSGKGSARSVEVSNVGAAMLYIGANDVSVGAGFSIVAGGKQTLRLLGGDELYGVVAVGLLEVRILETEA